MEASKLGTCPSFTVLGSQAAIKYMELDSHLPLVLRLSPCCFSAEVSSILLALGRLLKNSLS